MTFAFPGISKILHWVHFLKGQFSVTVLHAKQPENLQTQISLKLHYNQYFWTLYLDKENFPNLIKEGWDQRMTQFWIHASSSGEGIRIIQNYMEKVTTAIKSLSKVSDELPLGNIIKWAVGSTGGPREGCGEPESPEDKLTSIGIHVRRLHFLICINTPKHQSHALTSFIRNPVAVSEQHRKAHVF